MEAIVNSPTFSSPKLQNDRFAKVLPHQRFVLYGSKLSATYIPPINPLPVF